MSHATGERPARRTWAMAAVLLAAMSVACQATLPPKTDLASAAAAVPMSRPIALPIVQLEERVEVPRRPAIALEDAGSHFLGSPMPGQVLTSRDFGMTITFWVGGGGGSVGPPDPSDTELVGASPRSDWCGASTSPNAIVLPWRMACFADLRILRPGRVDCGTGDDHPDAASLAQALLANPGLVAHDLGSLAGSQLLPTDLFEGLVTGRFIEVRGLARAFDPAVDDPDSCVINAGHDSIEVRGDMTALLLLLDVEDQLVVIRLADGGQDATSGAAARASGHGVNGSQELFDAMLARVHDISFRP